VTPGSDDLGVGASASVAAVWMRGRTATCTHPLPVANDTVPQTRQVRRERGWFGLMLLVQGGGTTLGHVFLLAGGVLEQGRVHGERQQHV
jgi:hypothetical protein